MDTYSVNEVASLINNQIESQQKIEEHLLKVEALALVALDKDFLDHKKSLINAYLWALCDIVFQLRDLHEDALDDLLKNRKQYQLYNPAPT